MVTAAWMETIVQISFMSGNYQTRRSPDSVNRRTVRGGIQNSPDCHPKVVRLLSSPMSSRLISSDYASEFVRECVRDARG
jgi:hypothetical protein